MMGETINGYILEYNEYVPSTKDSFVVPSIVFFTNHHHKQTNSTAPTQSMLS